MKSLSVTVPFCFYVAPSAPSFIHFSELTTSSVNMSWGEPKHPNGIIEGYRLIYEPCTPIDGEKLNTVYWDILHCIYTHTQSIGLIYTLLYSHKPFLKIGPSCVLYNKVKTAPFSIILHVCMCCMWALFLSLLHVSRFLVSPLQIPLLTLQVSVKLLQWM